MNDFLAWNMNRPRPWEEQPTLTDEDCDELFRLFDEAGLPPNALTAEMADGYLTACCVGPQPVTPTPPTTIRGRSDWSASVGHKPQGSGS